MGLSIRNKSRATFRHEGGDSCQLALYVYCTDTKRHPLNPMHWFTYRYRSHLFVPCFPLLLIVVKRLQLQCSFPLFSLCGNVLSKLSLNRENPAECSTHSSDRLQGWQRSHWQIGIISSLSILDQFVYQTVCLQLCICLYIHVPSCVPVCECSTPFSFILNINFMYE